MSLPVPTSRSRGFTMVELLVALSVAAILLTLVYQVFITQRRGYRTQDEVAEMQQNARIAVETLTRDLQNIGAEVPAGDPQLLHCGAYEIAFYADLDQDPATGPAAPATALAAPYSGGVLVTTPTTALTSDAETYVVGLKSNGSGDYDLVQTRYAGTAADEAQVALTLSDADSAGSVPLFLYWGDFDADPDPDLWGDADASGDLSAAEVAALTPVAVAGKDLDDVIHRVVVQVVAETETVDPQYGGKRQNVLRSNVTPRNLWPCPRFSVVPTADSLTLDQIISGAFSTKDYPFTVEFQNDPAQNWQVMFSLVNTSGGDGASHLVTGTGTPPAPPWWTDAAGVATATVDWTDCSTFTPHFNGGGGNLTYDLTATLPPYTSPFGTCPATSATVPITIEPGSVDRIAVTIHDDEITTCGAEDRFTFTAEGFDVCDIGVQPAAPFVNFSAPLTNGGGAGTVATNPFDASPKTFTVTRPGGNLGVPDQGNGRFGLQLVPSAYPPNGVGFAGGVGAGWDTVLVAPWPPASLDWNPGATLGPHEDCDAVTSSDAFTVRDCAAHPVWDDLGSNGFAEKNYQVAATLVPGSQLGAPADQGSIGAPGNTQVSPTEVVITTPAGGSPPTYDVTYTTPVCTLDPSQVPNGVTPHVELDLTGDDPTTNPGPPWTAMQLDSCLDSCTIEASIDGGLTWANPLVLSQCDTPSNVLIRISSCNLDGEDLQLTLTQSGGQAEFVGGTTATTTTVNLAGQSPSEATAEIRILTAADGARFEVTGAYFGTSASALWQCGALAIEVQNLCRDLRIYPDASYSQDLGQGGANDCLTEIGALYFEVDDCRFSTNMVEADGTFGAASQEGLWAWVEVAGTVYDFEWVDLRPSASAPPASPDRLRSEATASGLPGLTVVRDDGGPFAFPNGELAYPSGQSVTLWAAYTDPDDPTDDGCDESVRLTSPIPVCFPNAITSGGGAGWNGNFKVHWGDVVVKGNISLPSKFIEKSTAGQFNGNPFGGNNYTDRFADVYAGKSFPGDTHTGNYTGEPNPDPSTLDQPFKAAGYGNYFRNISFDKITEMIVVIDYETLKFLAQDRNVYWYTLPNGDIRNPATGQEASLQTVLSLPGPGLENAYHDGDFIFVDALGTTTAAPSFTGADIDAAGAAGTLPMHDVSGNFFTEGIIYIAGSVEFTGLGPQTSIPVRTPPEYELHYDHNDATWVPTEDDLPIRSDPGQTQRDFSIAVHINGALYVDGELTGSGNPSVYGSVTAERGYTGSGTPELWYNYNLNVSGFNESLCVDCCTMRVDPNAVVLSPGESLTLGAPNASGAVQWSISSNNPKLAGQTVVSLSPGGTVTAQSLGTATVRARDPNNCVATATVRVQDPCSRFATWGNLTPQWAVIPAGGSETFYLDYVPTGATVAWDLMSWPDGSASIVATGFDPVSGRHWAEVASACAWTSGWVQATVDTCGAGYVTDASFWVDAAGPITCNLGMTQKPASLQLGTSFDFEVTGNNCWVWWWTDDLWDGVEDYIHLEEDPADFTKATASTLAATPAGTTVTVFAQDQTGCMDSATFSVGACPTLTLSQSPAGAVTPGNTYTLTAAGGSEDYTWAIDPASTGSGNLTPSAAPDTETATFVPTAVGDVTVRVTDAAGCDGMLVLDVSCIQPTIAIAEPADGASFGALTPNGTSLVWQAIPDDRAGADPLDQVERVEFEVWRDADGQLIHSQTEFSSHYCGFGTDDCALNPGDLSGWDDGSYTLTATVYTTAGHPCGVTAFSDTIRIQVYNTTCPIAIAPPGPRTMRKKASVSLQASGQVGTVQWSSADTSLATVSPASGDTTLVTAANAPNSSVTIRAQDDRCFVDYRIDIIP